ncbi:hypothetical protein BVRB_8g190880 [Beta vulgaris subsp. vulgaris]|uniref:uncharacterized protein LOC104901667 n=1 Tax=Beta vulgaris subsp. vulgaris TaxID=3555 RepID=UPI00053FC4D8|nr:uncharacterized protein LOC104901667 [Beta vulgaris subsp. vulgaris]XP_010687562.1 uncharacterized protein LOC104901667 [Beta vulgaris subsp. vulgaris]KMT03400.1 hypothetical protein BVRB_8g190880 [Beta vulgaris subsp. vulgaris]
MENVQSAFRKISKDAKTAASSAMEAQSTHPPSSSSSLPYGVLATRPSRQWVSIWTCSKLCAACFVAGIFVGYTLKRRVRRWISNLLRRMKDD